MNTHPTTCHPLTLSRSIADFPIANTPVHEHRRRLIDGHGLTCHPQAWLHPGDTAAFLASGAGVMADASGTALLWHGAEPGGGQAFAAAASFLIVHPWDFLRANEQVVAGLAVNAILGEVHPSVVIEGVVHLGPGSRILPGVFIEGNVVIGSGCKIGPNCYLRGQTSVGDSCHIGQAVEIKNSILLAKTSVGHLSYVGDSILGAGVNFGAGTITSNLRHDGRNHHSTVEGRLTDTGRRKLGAIVGDGVHTGIHTAIYPGRKLWPHATTRPGEVVQRDIVTP
ncbi:MAG: hypothetical protein MUF04_03385 [Akkermansiaceae bacterium]|jgi:bifunctional UDP-N-acetylglucosamine pyrophosphorylase/glucosamine-1-phosphate N-acetyltransferase|nr:hypothetical protein [Akkermansiaceae bacterium]